MPARHEKSFDQSLEHTQILYAQANLESLPHPQASTKGGSTHQQFVQLSSKLGKKKKQTGDSLGAVRIGTLDQSAHHNRSSAQTNLGSVWLNSAANLPAQTKLNLSMRQLQPNSNLNSSTALSSAVAKVQATNIHASATKPPGKVAQQTGTSVPVEPRQASKHTFDSKSKSLSYMGDQSLEQAMPSADGSGVYYPL